MAKQNKTNTICECRYALEEDPQETKDNNIPNIHEIDEAESETEEMIALDQLGLFASDEGDEVVKTKDIDNESVYIDESFCSDESCDEVTNVTSGSLNTSSLIHVTDLSLSQSSKEQEIGISESSWKDNCQDESYLSSDELPRATTADRDSFTKSRKCRRWNMSFTDEEMRKIERENELLLRKIMAQQKPRHKILGEDTVQSRTSSSAINRKKLQKKIENDNMLLLRRIQQAKSCVFANTSKIGCRLTFL
ncbi:CFA97 protein, partial [Acromyrmex heyeri]